MNREVNLEELYHIHAKELWRFFRSRTGDEEVSLDLVQTLFLRLVQLEQKDAIRKKDARALLYRSARNLLSDHLKKRRDTEPLPENLNDDRTKTDQVEEWRSFVGQLLDSSSLPERVRMALDLRLFGQLDIAEIAMVCEVSRSTINRDLDGGLAWLRKELEKNGFPMEEME